MTPDGLPETERELTLAGLDGVSPRDLAGGFDAGLTLAEAAERIGVPVVVLQRWCVDGTVPAGDGYRGHASRPGALRIERAWVDDFLEQGEVVL